MVLSVILYCHLLQKGFKNEVLGPCLALIPSKDIIASLPIEDPVSGTFVNCTACVGVTDLDDDMFTVTVQPVDSRGLKVKFTRNP